MVFQHWLIIYCSTFYGFTHDIKEMYSNTDPDVFNK